MTTLKTRSRTWIWLTLLLCWACLSLVMAAENAPSVERIVSLPRIDGTAPSRPAWSPDSQQIAFLWNDHGMPFRDLWLARPDGSETRRLTRHAPASDSVLGSGSELSLGALQARAREREHGGIADLVWHPNGHAIFYVLDGTLRVLDIDDGQERTLGAGGGGLAISPDGQFLSMLRGGDLWLLNIEESSLARLTELGAPGIGSVPIGAFNRPDAYVGRYQWSPDSRHIAFEFVDQRQVRRVPFPSYLHQEPILHEVRRPYPGDTDLIRNFGIVEPEGSRIRWIELEDPNRRLILDFEWSPDGQHLLIMQGADVAEERWIMTVQAATGQSSTLWHDHRPRRVYPIFRALWNHDGSEILFTGDHEDYYRLYALPVEGGEPRRLTGDYDIAGDRSAPWIARENQTGDILFVAAKSSPNERHVYRLERDGEVVRVTTMAGVHHPTLSPAGDYLALLSSNDTTPMEMYSLKLGGGDKELRLTHSPLPEFNDYQWLEPRYVSFPSRIDDFTIHARIIEPPDLDRSKRYPVILGSIYSNTVLNAWNPDRPTSVLQQQMAMSGDYMTVLVDVRGSVGYGVAFREAFQGDWGRDDLEDLHSAVEYLSTLDHVDSDRIGIWGNSYGGLLVLSALFKKPGLFAAGVAGAPAVDIWHFTGYDQHLTRHPDTHPDIFARGSLLDLGENLNDPLLIIHGLHDDIVPLKTTLMMTEKLRLLGKRFELDIPHDSGHWWAASDHYARYSFWRLDDFLRRHVPPGPR